VNKALIMRDVKKSASTRGRADWEGAVFRNFSFSGASGSAEKEKQNGDIKIAGSKISHPFKKPSPRDLRTAMLRVERK